MSKKDVFGKNKNRLVKKVVIYAIAMILIAGAFIPIASSCHTPGIKITKTGPIFSYIGDEITYNYNVSNTGDVPLRNVNITDDKCGPVNYVSGDENENGKLDTNEIWTFTCTYTPSFTFPDPLVNTATASSVWKKKTVNASDDYTLYPFILRKDVLLYWEGENIDYNDPDTQFTINMSKDGEVLDTFIISESAIKRLWLSEGIYQFCEIDLPDGYESAYGCISHTTGQDYPDFTHLNVITFDLAIEKSGPEYCFPGNNITYYYQVTNDGHASVTPVVEDDICGTPIFTGGDIDGDGLIDPDETWTYESNYTVVEEPGSFINNTANVTDAEGAGRPPDQWWLGGDRNLSNNIDDWSAEVICPDPEDEYTLTINYEENGTVTKNPDQSIYTYGTLVELTATADPGWTFDHWDGDLSGSENPATISMTGDKTVTATFTEDQYTLTININGSGTVSKDPDQETYTYGMLVNLTATADPGWTFNHWDGDLSSSENPENITMDDNKTIIANFSKIEDEGDEDEYTLTINVIGSGSVAKDPDQPTYLYGTLVNLTANADGGWMFNHWSGDLSGSENPENITMDSNKTVIANFTEIEDEGEDPEGPVVTIKSSGRSYSTNLLPVANASGPYYGVIDEEIEFDGSGSYDPDGTITHYGWSFGDGNTGYGEVVKHTYSNSRSYLVTLAISDNNGATDIDKTIAHISVPNSPPSIPMVSGPNGSKDTKYSYAFGSTDPDNDDINYIINWGDNTINESGFLPSGHYFFMLHSWAKSGEYNITVTASDNQSTSSSEMTVLIEENIVMDNIAIVVLGILALIALLISLLYIKKGKKKN